MQSSTDLSPSNNLRSTDNSKQRKIILISQRASFQSCASCKARTRNLTKLWTRWKVWTSKKFWNNKWWIHSTSLLRTKKTKTAGRMVVAALLETTRIKVTSLATATKKVLRMLRMKQSKGVTTQQLIKCNLSQPTLPNFSIKASAIPKRNQLLKIMVTLQINFYHTIRSTRCSTKHRVPITTKYLSCRIRKDPYQWAPIVVKIVTGAIIAITFSNKWIT